MAKRVFSLGGVPDDEADDIRQLLENAGVDYYETPPGPFAITAAALWLNQDSEYERIKQLIDDYQTTRALTARQHYQQAKLHGELPGLLQTLWRNPLLWLVVIASIAIVLLVVLLPFLLIAL